MARTRGKQRFDVVNEQVVLAAVLSNEAARKRALGCLKVRDFLGARHRVIFKAVAKCEARGLRVEFPNIAAEAGGADFGGLDYLRNLRDMGAPDGFDQYLDRLRKDSARVRARKLLDDLDVVLNDPGADWSDCMGGVAEVLGELKAAPVRGAGVGVEIDGWVDNLHKRRSGEAEGIFRTTGYPALDEVLGEGFALGSVTVLAARPRMGKTTMIVDQVARLLKKTDARILVCAIEKGRDYFLGLLASRLSGVPKGLITKAPEEMTDKQAAKVERVMRKAFGSGRLEVIGNPVGDLLMANNWDNEQAVTRMGEILSSGRYDLAYWDVWQYMLPDTRPQSINMAITRFYELNRSTHTHSVVVHHVTRRAEDRRYNKSRRPTLIDLRDSGAYEQRLDLVMFLHREKVFKPYMRGSDVVEMIVAKQKSGDDGVVIEADFEPAVCRLRKPRFQRARVRGGRAEDSDERKVSE